MADSSSRWPLLGLGLVAAALIGTAFGPSALARWRAGRTARAYVHALRMQDSVTLARLSARGSAHNSLCASRLWPANYWTRDGRDAPVQLRYLWKDTAFYRSVGTPLPGDTAPARFEFQIALRTPTKASRYTIARIPRSVYDSFHACIQE
jgi:hypothetical protein